MIKKLFNRFKYKNFKYLSFKYHNEKREWEKYRHLLDNAHIWVNVSVPTKEMEIAQKVFSHVSEEIFFAVGSTINIGEPYFFEFELYDSRRLSRIVQEHFLITVLRNPDGYTDYSHKYLAFIDNGEEELFVCKSDSKKTAISDCAFLATQSYYKLPKTTPATLFRKIRAKLLMKQMEYKIRKRDFS